VLRGSFARQHNWRLRWGIEEEKHTMKTNPNYPSDVNSDNVVTLDDLSEDDRGKIERELEEWKAEFLKRYFKTRNGVVHKVTVPNSSPSFDTQVQSSTNDGRLIVKGTKTMLNSDTFPTNVIDFENKKILIQSDQIGSTREKNVIIDGSALPKMINPKNAKVEAWKVNGKNNQAPRPKPAVSMLLKKIHFM
jgi:hypothetical protein